MVKAILEILSRLTQILTAIMAELERRRREKESRTRQEKADAARKNPAGAFNAHFGGGVRDNDGTDASETDKTGDHGNGA